MDRKPARSGFTRWISAADRVGSHNIQRFASVQALRLVAVVAHPDGRGISPPLPGAGELSGYKNFKKDKKGLAIYMYM